MHSTKKKTDIIALEDSKVIVFPARIMRERLKINNELNMNLTTSISRAVSFRESGNLTNKMNLIINRRIDKSLIMKTSANYISSLLMAVFLIFPSIIRAEDTGSTIKRNRISWALMPQFNLNTPGNWKTFKPYDKTNISYGGGIGGACRIKLKGNWFFDAGTSICYDNLHVSASKAMPFAFNLERWSIPISTSIGHSFGISDEMDILPLAGIEGSYCFSNKVSDSFDMPDFNWNRLNLSWGIGCGLCFYDKYEIDIIGYFGLLHMVSQSDTDLYDNKIRMSIKYFF